MSERAERTVDRKKKKETLIFQDFLYKKIKRVMGIEPTYPAWKAGVLPLNYTRIAYRGDRIRTCDLLVPNQAL